MLARWRSHAEAAVAPLGFEKHGERYDGLNRLCSKAIVLCSVLNGERPHLGYVLSNKRIFSL